MKLTDENYYESEANWKYMSVSQFKKFMKCEAAAMAELKGEFSPLSDPKPLLVGNYVHSYFESKEAHERFKEQHKDKIFSSRKPHGLLKDFQIAEQMIARIEHEPMFEHLWKGESEEIVTGELFGFEWKGKIDKLNKEAGYFVDLKTAADLRNRIYDTRYRGYVSFVEAYGYVMQMAMYEELLKQKYDIDFTGVIYAVTKQTPSDVAAIVIEERKKGFELDYVETMSERIMRVKMGEEKPEACGVCEYCRGVKILKNLVVTDDLLRD